MSKSFLLVVCIDGEIDGEIENGGRGIWFLGLPSGPGGGKGLWCLGLLVGPGGDGGYNGGKDGGG